MANEPITIERVVNTFCHLLNGDDPQDEASPFIYSATMLPMGLFDEVKTEDKLTLEDTKQAALRLNEVAVESGFDFLCFPMGVSDLAIFQRSALVEIFAGGNVDAVTNALLSESSYFIEICSVVFDDKTTYRDFYNNYYNSDEA